MSAEITRDLADLRAFVQKQIEDTEKKIRDLEDTLASLKQALKTIDRLLVQQSFKPASSLVEEKKEIPTEEIQMLKSKSGTTLAKLIITPDVLKIVPVENFKIDIKNELFNNFFLNKVLVSLQKEDSDKVERGLLEKDKVIDYEILARDNKIAEIIVKNYKDQKTLKRIVNALRWTMEKIYGL
ncbi:MAG: hypothetical protein ACP6IU_07010 [Candidatus Asgardarchaeia archaeon]